MVQPSLPADVLSQPQFADRVPPLAHRSLMSIAGCLDGLAAELSITPLLVTTDACYLITAAFAIVIEDPALTDEYGASLFQQVALEQVVALLNSGFTTLWTPIDRSLGSGQAVVQHAAARAAAASDALRHALRVNGDAPVTAIVPMLGRIATDLAVPIGMLALQAADDADTATENVAAQLSAQLGCMAEHFEQLLRRR